VEEEEALQLLAAPLLQEAPQPLRKRSQPRKKRRRRSQMRTWASVCSIKRIVVE
jgi:hypothetical protein